MALGSYRRGHVQRAEPQGQLPTFPYEWRVIQEPVIQEPRPLAYTVI